MPLAENAASHEKSKSAKIGYVDTASFRPLGYLSYYPYLRAAVDQPASVCWESLRAASRVLIDDFAFLVSRAASNCDATNATLFMVGLRFFLDMPLSPMALMAA